MKVQSANLPAAHESCAANPGISVMGTGIGYLPTAGGISNSMVLKPRSVVESPLYLAQIVMLFIMVFDFQSEHA